MLALANPAILFCPSIPLDVEIWSAFAVRCALTMAFSDLFDLGKELHLGDFVQIDSQLHRRNLCYRKQESCTSFQHLRTLSPSPSFMASLNSK